MIQRERSEKLAKAKALLAQVQEVLDRPPTDEDLRKALSMLTQAEHTIRAAHASLIAR